ncbi:hypothetical protein LQT59_26705 (plasmid) [Escherichia coli]|nr:hypothetical protein LQT59_26100 [Escherichia coli]UGD32851.1 hypothetical protein LQT59_26705 [Escherichia coli]
MNDAYGEIPNGIYLERRKPCDSAGNAGILTTEQIAQLLHTNITAVRNMAYRLKLSLRVTAYNHRRIAQVQALYASETLSLKEIAAKTGLTASTVQYIVYVKSKISPTPPRNMSL